jgi:hypothetical protein
MMKTLKSHRKNSGHDRGKRLTALGIVLGIFLAATIGFILCLLNAQHRFE